jgi:hypothetical protein
MTNQAAVQVSCLDFECQLEPSLAPILGYAVERVFDHELIF